MRDCLSLISKLTFCLVLLGSSRFAVAGATPTTTTLSASVNGLPATTVAAHTAVLLQASVFSSSVALIQGQVDFCDASAVNCTDIHLLGTAQITASGTATMKLVPGPGARQYKAVFHGTQIYAKSSSPIVALLILAATGPVQTKVGVLASGSQGNYGLLGTAATNGPASPTGAISFFDTTNANYGFGSAVLGPTGSSGISFQTSYSLVIPRTGTSNSGGGGGKVVTADFNGDGIPDLAVDDGAENALRILLGKGDGTFSETRILSSPNRFYQTLFTADVNGDGKADLITATNDGLLTLLGNGDGTFTAVPLQSPPGALLAVADFNGDGNVDILTLTSVTTSGVPQFFLQVLLGNGDGTFTPLATNTPIHYGDVQPIIADFNGDGAQDVAIIDPYANVIDIFLGNGDGSFRAAPDVGDGITVYQSLVAGDLNGDGKTDLVASNQSGLPATIFLGNGDGTFTTLPPDPNLNQISYSIALADFNGDGIPDLIFPNENGGYTSVFIGKGDGTFTPDAFSPSVANTLFVSLAVADFNGDGQADIAEFVVDGASPPVVGDSVQVLLSQAPNTAAGYIYNVSPVGTGLHYIVASYPGDANNGAGVSTPVALIAQQVATNLTLVVAPAGGSAVGQPVTLSASLDQHSAQNHEASGNVVFYSGGKSVGTVAVSNGTAILTSSSLPAGTDNLKAVYAGDTNFLGSTSATIAYPVTTPKPQTITFPQPATPAFAGTSVQLTATASSGLPVAYTVVSGPATVSGTILTYTGAGIVVLEADQAGGSASLPATSVQQTVMVNVLSQPVGTASGPVVTAVTFTAAGTLNAVAYLTQGAPNLDFIQAQFGLVNGSLAPCTTGTSYAAGQSCLVGFALRPTAPGTRYGAVSLTDGNGTPLATANVYGRGVGPHVTWRPGTQKTLVTNVLVAQNLGLAVDGAGNLFFATKFVGLMELKAGTSTPVLLSSSYKDLTGIAVDGSGNLFVTDPDNSTVGAITELLASTNYTTIIPLRCNCGSEPEGVVVDGNGNVFVADTGRSALQEFTVSSGYTQSVRIPVSFQNPGGLALDSGANLFVASYVSNGFVQELTASSGYTIARTVTGSIIDPSGLAMDANDNLYVTDGYNNGVMEFSAASGYQTQTTPFSGLTFIGLAFDGSGNVYVSDGHDGTILEFDVNTPPSLTFAATPVGLTSIDSPQTVTITNTGNASLSYAVPGSGYNPAITPGFTIGSASTCPRLIAGSSAATLSPDTSCTDAVSFTPLTAGSNSGTLVTTDSNLNASAATQTVFLNGTGLPTAPTITFTVPNHTYGDAPFSVMATSSSPGTITYSVVSGPATIAGSTVTLNGIGSVVLLASQAASGIYAAASQTATFMVAAESPTITFAVPNHTFGDPPFLVAATSNSGGGFTYTVVSGPATVSGSIVTLTGTGNVVLQVNQAAAGNFTAGSQTASFVVAAASPGIAFFVGNQTYGVPPFTVSATSNSAGTFTYSVVSGPATVSGSTVTLTGIGSVVLQASQAASGNYGAASKTASFLVSAAAPTITFSVPNHSYGDAPFIVLASSNSSGVLSYSVVSGPATVLGSTVTLTGAGPVTLLASQAASGPYSTGSQSATFTVSKQAQTISFLAPASPVNFGSAPVALTAKASSSLAVSFSIVSGPATVSGNTLSFIAAGTVVVAADQAGNSNYGAAPEVTRTIVVLGRVVSIGLSAGPNPVFLRNPLTLRVNLAATGGNPTGTILFLDGANPLGTVGVSGSTATLVTSALALGIHTITAVYSGDGVFTQLTSSPVVVTVQDFGLAATNPSVTIDHGGTATYNLILSSIGGTGMASVVNFVLSGAPSGSEITFTPQSVPTGSGTTSVALVIHTPNYPTGPSSSARVAQTSEISLAFLTLGALLLPFRRGWTKLGRGKLLGLFFVIVSGAMSTLALTGCGSGWKAQTWTMQVTASSGQLSRATTLILVSQCSDGRTACAVEK